MTSCLYAASSSTATSFDTKYCFTTFTDTANGDAVTFGLSSVTDTLTTGLADLISVTDQMWVLTCAVFVFWMQAGFAMLEAGSVRKKNTNNILFKNLMDASIGAICWWLLGYSFAFGTGKYDYDDPGQDNKFIGAGNWALQNYNNDNGYYFWFFQWTFAGACATIVSGCVAERCRLEGYFIYTILLTTFIYPVVVHWVWSSTGWLSAFAPTSAGGDVYLHKNGMIDFAGSGVVHMTGGFAGLVGAIAIGPRVGFGDPSKLKGHSDLLAALGTSILWMGWYGFNCGSTLGAGSGSIGNPELANGAYIQLAGKVAVTTTIAAASAAITCMVASRVFTGQYMLTVCLNGVLAGLVSITAPCSVVEPWAAMMIGIIGAIVYGAASKGIKLAGIDDPLDAFPVHGACGIWGVLSVGIFATESNIARYYGKQNNAVQSGNQFRNQLIGVLAIMAWVVGTSSIIFFPLKFAGLLRVSAEEEEAGLDASEHGVDPKQIETESKAV
mmetsp:Transcript_11957/g.21813  ORF Transcript_11957/g.21813 Transcript_11957/m.21813 type:complete len:497 (-) Transcript_11957:521-2011(-)|eukprot:CAMPEP_0197525004 /NCGR_PEP_ID=MMETSP1318-20131121/10557_1 /TAXON_ID=552666 /ORGANISM="Partenskyella glossopodia, Strain RCC365" /LENGTH=496 /DNA_ID=CAMNT_0043078145 /DNA_START=74 /DNA_END=1564 /DNA_ORIENTATION=+